MIAPPLDPGAPLSETFRIAIGDRLSDYLDRHDSTLTAIGPELAPMMATMRSLVGGGKRLRPAYVVWGAIAAGGLPEDPGPLLDAAASLDLLHASALVHDDVMDASDLRRGSPTAHRQFSALHQQQGWVGDGEAFGRAGAILLGDLLLMWSVEMVHSAGLAADRLAAARPYLEAMRTEVTCGQFLDVVAQARDLAGTGTAAALDEADRVTQYKAASYTVQRPVQFGAVVGGANEDLIAALARYGSATGRAFQFRDDLLDLVGDPARTGKTEVGNDLREGKRTVLVAHAWSRTSGAGRAILARHFGRPGITAAEIGQMREVIVGSGAVEIVESAIERLYEEALTALASASMTDPGRVALRALADAAVHRQF